MIRGHLSLHRNFHHVDGRDRGALDPTYLGYLDTLVNYATGEGMLVILDAHNYGRAWGLGIGVAGGTPNSAFASFWSAVAIHYKANPLVAFGLMNEPGATGQTAALWLASCNAANSAIRSAGATSQLIVVPVAIGDGASGFIPNGNDTVFNTGVVDPNNNYAIELHQYFDSNGSGTQAVPVGNGYVPPEILTDATVWARKFGLKLVLGEFGADTGPDGVAAIRNCMQFLQNNSDVWIIATQWGAGNAWGNYVNGMDPVNGQDQPTTLALASFAPGGSSVGQALATKKYPITYSGATFGPGRFGECLTAGSASVNGGDCSNMRLSSAVGVLTLDGWVRCAGAPGSPLGIATNANFANLFVNSDGTALARCGQGDAIVLSSSAFLADGVFRQVKLVCHPGGTLLFVGGVLVASTSTTLASVGYTGSFPFTFGSNGLSVDEVAFWGVPTHTANFTPPSAPYAGTELGLYAAWHFDGPTDTFGYG